MNNNCDVNAENIKKLDERVTRLEHYREKDKAQLFELDKSLSVFIEEMKHISEDLKSVVSNFKETVNNSTSVQEKEINHLREQVAEQGKKIEALDSKLENETVGKSAKKWENIVSYIVTTAVGLIIGFIAMYLGLK